MGLFSSSIGAIQPGLSLLETRIPAPTSNRPDFGSALKEAVSALDGLDKRANASTLRLATGGPVDLHEVMLNTQQASFGFQLAVQVRNKLVEAYQDIMRMSL